ncbi:MAG TPA: PDZ domain-containing protein [Candidatus Gallibacteroides avistercoris]|uniref:PDZ domain-containing protein n=1 Tax=Candidatus Gallibacteroides avistercoris TaxID=2840833 RepID=A0A9D1M9J6_9BACT|nr:PDZ domain-containing protein [Candidatus Gallibacteroides avistercoris]
MNKKRFVWLPLIIAVAVCAGIYAGNFYTRISLSGRNFSSLAGQNKIDNLINIIDRHYVDSINPEEIIEKVMPKIMKELDPHSLYIKASDFEKVNEPLEGSFSGIGIQFNMAIDTVTVVSVIPGGPSEKVGLLAGDRIVTINDTTYVGKEVSMDDISSRLRGPKGTTVKVGIKRATSKELLPFEITRGDIPLNSVDASFMIDKKTGYIKISRFGRTTYNEFMNALAQLRNSGASNYIIDLRGNSGGYMDEAINMVNEFLPKDRLIVYTEGKASPRNEAYSNGTGAFQTNPIVVLMDEWSGSASEIFAGAIQDNDRGTIVGVRSYGKGLVQQQIPFADGSAIRLTIARYYTPSGRSIQREYKLGESEEYELDYISRLEHGELLSQDSIKQNDSLRYETYNGRTVYGGGGITPDIFVPRDTTNITSYFLQIMNTGALYRFAFEYADKNRETLKQYNNCDSLLAYLQSQPLLEEFVSYAQSKGIKRRPVYIQISRQLILDGLYAYIIRNTLEENDFYQVLAKNDKTILKAQEILREGKSFPQAPAKPTEQEPVTAQ